MPCCLVKDAGAADAGSNSFNVNGKQHGKSWAGGIVSLIIFGLSLVFMLLKFRHLMEQQNPSIATFDQELELGADNAFELDDEDFMLAFGIDHY